MLTEVDKALLNAVQGDLPLASRPFAVLAERLGTDEEALLARLRALKEEGYVRRMGAYFQSEALGYQGSLVALDVEPERMDEVAAAVNRYPTVTHNYERNGAFNLWFTLQVASERARDEVLTAVAALPGVRRCLNLPSERKYKIRVQFALH
ncbi:MAG: siroheme decarboxylase subunit alpha [Schwartzia sp. (in: firmicutes)]